MNSPRFRRTRAKPSGFTWTHGSYQDKAAAFNLSELLAPQTGDAVWNVHDELGVFALLVGPSGIKQRPSCEGFGR